MCLYSAERTLDLRERCSLSARRSSSSLLAFSSVNDTRCSSSDSHSVLIFGVEGVAGTAWPVLFVGGLIVDVVVAVVVAAVDFVVAAAAAAAPNVDVAAIVVFTAAAPLALEAAAMHVALQAELLFVLHETNG